MSKQQLQSYRLTSTEEPTDEMLDAIMQGVAIEARKSKERAQKELDRRFNELKKQISMNRKTIKK